VCLAGVFEPASPILRRQDIGRRDKTHVARLLIPMSPAGFARYPHMDPAEAYRAFWNLGESYGAPCTGDIFDLADEPVD
jgi:hypothetical protein